MVLAFVATALMVGGFNSFAQFNIPEVGRRGVVEPIQKAQQQETAKLAEGMATGTPPPTGEQAAEEKAPVSLEEIPEDFLRNAIAAAAGQEAFAETATKIVRAYIHKIKVAPRAFETEFEPGNEPWRSKKAEVRYSPFDPMLITHKGPAPEMQAVPPFLPPIEKVGPAIPGLNVLKNLVKLRMTSKSDGDYIALAEIAGIPVNLRVGDSLDPEHKFLPGGTDIVIEGISMDGVLFRSGNEHVLVAFAGAEGTEEKPFDIKITK